MPDDAFDERHDHMSICPPAPASCLTFPSGLHLRHLPLLLLVQPLQLGRLEDPRVHLEHPHSRLGLRAQHHQHSAGGWCSLTTGVDPGACAVEAGSLRAGAAI